MNAPSQPSPSPTFGWTTMAALPLEGRVDLWQRAYEAYAMPAHFDAAILDLMAKVGDLVDERSPVLLTDGEPVGFGALGLRGDHAWLGGFGVALPWRRRGLGRRLMAAWFEAARAAGARHAQLEVLEPNVGARALYEAEGFAAVRWLEVWSLAARPADVSTEGVRRMPATEAMDAVERLPGADEPWQRGPAVARKFASEIVGLAVGPEAAPTGVAVVRVAGGRESVQRLRVLPGERAAADIAALLAAAHDAGGGPLRWLNLPEGDPASDVLRTLGGTLDIRQVEMARAL